LWTRTAATIALSCRNFLLVYGLKIGRDHKWSAGARKAM
jgi:hypothetical protein